MVVTGRYILVVHSKGEEGDMMRSWALRVRVIGGPKLDPCDKSLCLLKVCPL